MTFVGKDRDVLVAEVQKAMKGFLDEFREKLDAHVKAEVERCVYGHLMQLSHEYAGAELRKLVSEAISGSVHVSVEVKK